MNCERSLQLERFQTAKVTFKATQGIDICAIR